MPRHEKEALEDVRWLGGVPYQPLSNIPRDGCRILPSQITRRLKKTVQSWCYQYMSRDSDFQSNAPKLAKESNYRCIERFLDGWWRSRKCATGKNLRLLLFGSYKFRLEVNIGKRNIWKFTAIIMCKRVLFLPPSWSHCCLWITRSFWIFVCLVHDQAQGRCDTFVYPQRCGLHCIMLQGLGTDCPVSYVQILRQPQARFPYRSWHCWKVR